MKVTLKVSARRQVVWIFSLEIFSASNADNAYNLFTVFEKLYDIYKAELTSEQFMVVCHC